MARLKVATIGAGHFAQFHHDAWSRMPEATLVAVCDLDIARARAFARRWHIPAVYTDMDEMLDDARPDLVDIVTPPDAHLSLIRAAAEHHVPMICQRPFCRSIAEADEAVAAAERARVPLIVHENFRFQPWYEEIAALLSENRIGHVWQATFRFRPGDGQGQDAYRDREARFRSMERFLIHETGSRFVDLFRNLFGEVRTVFARLERRNPAIAGEDSGLVLLEMGSGVRAVFDGNRLADHPAQNRHLIFGELLIEGAEGSLRLDGDGRIFLRAHGRNEETEHAYAWDSSGFAGDSVLRLQQHVAAHLRDGAPLVNHAREYIANMRVENAIYRSAESGAVVALAPPAAEIEARRAVLHSG